MLARDAAHGTPAVVDPDTGVAEAARRMLAGDDRTVIVVDSGRVVGILTERDMIARVVSRDLHLSIPVGVVMTPDPLTLPASAPLVHAYAVLREHGFKRLPLVDSDQGLVGLLRLEDLTSELTAETLTTYGQCPHCGGRQLRPVNNGETSNLFCLRCRACWRPEHGELVRVDPDTCPGCPDQIACRFPEILF